MQIIRDLIFYQPAQVLVSAFLGVLFLQSGLDKIFDWSGNLSFLKGHFANSPLKNKVPALLAIITVFEILSGLASAVGALEHFIFGSSQIALIGAVLSAVSLLMLFFGQRMAKDYAGAAVLANYFLLALFAIVLLKHSF